MTFEIETLGCKVNEYESRYYASVLEKAGFIPAEKQEPADIYVINSCTVTNTAAAKSRQRISRMKKKNPKALIVLAGCYGQSLSEEQRKQLQVDVIVGGSHKDQLAEIVKQALETHEKVDMVEDVSGYTNFEEMPVPDFGSRHRAFLKVEDGCNQFCTYCAIPLVRGRERSMDFDQVLSQAKQLEQAGYQEIVLTGIHTGRYTSGTHDLADLLNALLLETGSQVKYRISSIEITEVSNSLIELMRENDRILPHLHIPIQSASNATLKRMGRPYTVEQFRERLEEIRQAIPQISVSTDVIAGFVQESEEEFHETLRNLEDLRFSFLHVFPYSSRDNTAASRMAGHLNGTIVKERTAWLLDLSDRLRAQDMARFETVEVLIERKGKEGWMGYSAQYHPVIVESDVELPGRFVSGYDEIVQGSYRIHRKGMQR